MVQFNLNRFGKLAKWTLSYDKSYYVKLFLQVLTVSALLFIFFTTRFFTFNTDRMDALFGPCALIYVGMLLVHLFLAPSLMFYSFKNKHDDQTYMLLPASNFEKYVARYVTTLLLLVVFLVALVAGDLIQFLVNLLLGAEHQQLVLSYLMEKMSLIHISGYIKWRHILTMFTAFFWLQSFYALGGTFFRSHKYAWIFTTLLLIVGSMCISWVVMRYHAGLYVDTETPLRTVILTNTFHLIWACANYWLSFKCFCRSQVIGKFINI